MTKREAEKEWRESILPEIRKQYEPDGRVDGPARAEAWNNYTDILLSEGRITEKQYETWCHPK